jgi:hypothetical protein
MGITVGKYHLLEQNLSNSCRNTIIYTLKLIMREAKREGIIEVIPEFEPFKRSGEIRTLYRDQVSIPNIGLLIDRAVDDNGEIGPL